MTTQTATYIPSLKMTIFCAWIVAKATKRDFISLAAEYSSNDYKDTQWLNEKPWSMWFMDDPLGRSAEYWQKQETGPKFHWAKNSLGIAYKVSDE